MTKFVSIFCLALIFWGCVDNDDVRVRKNLLNLQMGKYWVYRTKIIHQDESFYYLSLLDSAWIEGDTIINGIPYMLQHSTRGGDYYFRDSADCVLMRQLSNEQIIYSENLRDTLLKNPPVYKVVTDVDKIVQTSTSAFRTSNCRTLLRKTPGASDHGTHLPSYDQNFYTAEQFIVDPEVGLVKRVHYYVGNSVEYELIRYGNQ